jgi:hypothetical protein
MWPLLVVAACAVFLSDIFVRRVQVNFSGVKIWLTRFLTRRKTVETPATLARLSAKKAEVRQRYQAPPQATPAQGNLPRVEPTSEPQQAAAAKPQAAKSTEPVEPTVEESMTSRLLAAKKAVKDNRWRR